nr:hypothetical protein [Paraburkholderia mimosarum]
MTFIAGMSPVAWRHVNLLGAMDFGAATMPVDIDALASYYADPEYWARMLQAGSSQRGRQRRRQKIGPLKAHVAGHHARKVLPSMG